MNRPATLGQLRESGYRPRTVKQEIRANLRRQLGEGTALFPGVFGYEETVLPGIVNALLAGHDFILLGLRGQAKTRLLRALTSFLDPEVPVIAGSELHEDPLAPFTPWGRSRVAVEGDDLPVEWLLRDARYNEKLATPDVSIADLLGDVDPIKAATRKLTYADPEVIHYGIVPRTNRGIFAINELPDLAPRIQVGLLNLLEERDLQIRGFPLRLPLDLLLVFSANPEDYTNRGSIITPLKDRIASQILTHYPPSLEVASRVTAQEAWVDREDSGIAIEIPAVAKQLVERLAFVARESDLVDPSSGVSARVGISAMELLVSNLERRAWRTGDSPCYPRLCDFSMLLPALTGKLEMVYEGEEQGVEIVVRRLIGEASKQTFLEHFPEVDRAAGSGGEDDDGPYAELLRWFADGGRVTLSDALPYDAYLAALHAVPGLPELVDGFDEKPEVRAFAMELVLEGLCQHLKLAREDLDSQVSYKEVLKFELLRPRRPEPGSPGWNH